MMSDTALPAAMLLSCALRPCSRCTCDRWRRRPRIRHRQAAARRRAAAAMCVLAVWPQQLSHLLVHDHHGRSTHTARHCCCSLSAGWVHELHTHEKRAQSTASAIKNWSAALMARRPVGGKAAGRHAHASTQHRLTAWHSTGAARRRRPGRTGWPPGHVLSRPEEFGSVLYMRCGVGWGPKVGLLAGQNAVRVFFAPPSAASHFELLIARNSCVLSFIHSILDTRARTPRPQFVLWWCGGCWLLGSLTVGLLLLPLLAADATASPPTAMRRARLERDIISALLHTR